MTSGNRRVLAGAMCLLCVCAGFAADEKSDADSGIRATLDAQVASWNAGSIEGFMDGYVRGESLRFASGGTVQRGWQVTLDRYKKRYATPELMGQLAFTDLEIRTLSADYAEVFGQYKLKRGADVGDATGLFTLLMQRTDGRWLVLHDHTSAAE